MRTLFEAADAAHVLHHLDTDDARCRAQLAKRNRELPEGSVLLSEADFDYVNGLFQPPTAAEGLTLLRHAGRSADPVMPDRSDCAETP